MFLDLFNKVTSCRVQVLREKVQFPFKMIYLNLNGGDVECIIHNSNDYAQFLKQILYQSI